MTTNNFYEKGNFLEPATPDGKHTFKTIQPGKYSYEFLERKSPDWQPYRIDSSLPPVLVSPKGEVANCFEQGRDGEDIWTVMAQQRINWPPLEEDREYTKWEKGYLGVVIKPNPLDPDDWYLKVIHDLVGRIYVPRTELQVMYDHAQGRYVDKPGHQYDHLDSNTWNNFYLNFERVTADENKARRDHPERKDSAIKRNMGVYWSDEWPAGYATLEEWNERKRPTHIDSDIVFDPESQSYLPFINPYKNQ